LARQSGEPGEVAHTTEEPAAAGDRRCASPPESAIASLESSTAQLCGVSIELGDGQLMLRQVPALGDGLVQVAAGVGETLATGRIPEPCGDALERCELWGVHDALGPVLFLTVRGFESEVPEQVYVGWVDEQRLGFAPCWYGLPSVADHTRIGPPWALAPFACDGQLRLLPAARLPEAEGEDPSDAVRAAAGRWSVAADGSTALVELAPISNSSDSPAGECRPLFSALP
jgi:hypothetical protein